MTTGVLTELGLDRERTNVNGGAIALGHLLAASGSRITAHLVHEMRDETEECALLYWVSMHW